MKPNWEYHSICLLFPRHTTEERDELKRNMVERIRLGLDPLENDLVFFEKKLLDGRNRFEAWYELAEENACDGYFGRNLPPKVDFCPAKHGTLAAWMKAKALNIVHRNISADHKAAIFLEAVEMLPELKATIDEIREENAAKQKAGKPLVNSDQRVPTAKAVAKLAGVGATTVKAVQRLKKEAPEKFAEVVAGKTTAKKALKEIGKRKPKTEKAPPPKPKEITVGDTLYEVVATAGTPGICKHVIRAITAKCYGTSLMKRLSKDTVLFHNLDDARKEWRKLIEARIHDLKEALKNGPDVIERSA